MKINTRVEAFCTLHYNIILWIVPFLQNVPEMRRFPFLDHIWWCTLTAEAKTLHSVNTYVKKRFGKLLKYCSSIVTDGKILLCRFCILLIDFKYAVIHKMKKSKTKMVTKTLTIKFALEILQQFAKNGNL